MKRIQILILMFVISAKIIAQDTSSCEYELEGVMLDADTKEVLPYVLVKVKGTQHAVMTSMKGEFYFSGLCDSLNTLIISCFGYCDTTCESYHKHSKNPHFYLKQEVNSLNTVTITVEKNKKEGTESVAQNTVDKEALSADPSQSLASAISEIEGVTFTSTGSNVQLPVIHGLYGNRVLVLNNGFKHGFQNWGADHAPEIDISTANSVTVIKGAAGVRYGAEALGGAIIVESDPLYLNEPLKGKLGTGYQTNGRGYFLNTELSQGYKNWAYHAGVNYTRIGDRHTPDYSLTNSGKEEKSVIAGLRYNLKAWDFKVYYSYIDQDLAMLRASVAHSGNAFERAINSDKPIYIKPFSYDINAPNQLTKHHLGKAEVNWWYSNDAKFAFRYGVQLNKRKEFDVRRNSEKPIIDLDLKTNDFQLEWKHPDWSKLDGVIGLQVFTQDNDNNPGTGTTPFIPNYNILRYSGFIIESLKRGKNTFEIGIRLDYEYNNVRGREVNQAVFKDEYDFTNLTASLGSVRHISDNTTFRTNLGTAWRTPNMAELYSFGQHGFRNSYGLLRYYTDDSGTLKTDKVLSMSESQVLPEKGYKWINEFKTHKKASDYTFTAYVNYISNFIFERPIAVIGTIRGPMPAFIYDQADALFCGTDITWQKKWSDTFNGTFGFNYLWSKNVKDKEPLINQPPIIINYKLMWKTASFWKVQTSQVFIKPSYTFKQYQAPKTISPNELIDGTVDLNSDSEVFDFKDAPDGYFLLDIGWRIKLSAFGFAFTIQNVFNKSYRNYLNSMRYFADEPGRNFLFTINYKFKNKQSEKSK